MPLGGLTLTSVEDPPYSCELAYMFQVNFSREQLLKYDLWGKQVTD